MKKIQPILYISIACFLWGGSVVLSKEIMGQISYVNITLWRFVFASISIVPFVWKDVQQFKAKDFLALILVSFLTVPLSYLLQFKGISLTSVVNASLIMGAMPLVYCIVAWLLLNERLNKIEIIAVFISIIGMSLVIGSPVGRNNWLGNLLVAISLFSFALSALLSQKLMITYKPVIVSALIFWMGLLMLLPVILFSYGSIQLRFSSIQWVSLVLLGVVCTNLAYLFWYVGINKTPALTIGVYSNIQPVTGVFLAVIFLKEKISWIGIVGGVLVIASTIVISIYPVKQVSVKK